MKLNTHAEVVDELPKAVSDAMALPDTQMTMRDPKLQAQQKRLALAAIVIPFLGTIAAIVLAFWTGIGWVEISLLVVMYALTTLGATVGFHRYFAHRAFEAHPAVRDALAILGSMAAQGPLIFWTATHRRHHSHSDLPGDPHSPHLHGPGFIDKIKGQWHAHISWMFTSEPTNSLLYSKDLFRDPAILRINRLYPLWVILGLAIPTVLGGLITMSWMGALKGLLWGGFVRLFIVHHSFWAIGGIAHSVGWRAFPTREGSRNNFWLALPNFGEGWHNNHHAFPSSAFFGLAWWQVDVGGWCVRILERTGLIWNVKCPTSAMIESRKRGAAQGRAVQGSAMDLQSTRKQYAP